MKDKILTIAFHIACGVLLAALGIVLFRFMWEPVGYLAFVPLAASYLIGVAVWSFVNLSAWRNGEKYALSVGAIMVGLHTVGFAIPMAITLSGGRLFGIDGWRGWLLLGIVLASIAVVAVMVRVVDYECCRHHKPQSAISNSKGEVV